MPKKRVRVPQPQGRAGFWVEVFKDFQHSPLGHAGLLFWLIPGVVVWWKGWVAVIVVSGLAVLILAGLGSAGVRWRWLAGATATMATIFLSSMVGFGINRSSASATATNVGSSRSHIGDSVARQIRRGIAFRSRLKANANDSDLRDDLRSYPDSARDAVVADFGEAAGLRFDNALGNGDWATYPTSAQISTVLDALLDVQSAETQSPRIYLDAGPSPQPQPATKSEPSAAQIAERAHKRHVMVLEATSKFDQDYVNADSFSVMGYGLLKTPSEESRIARVVGVDDAVLLWTRTKKLIDEQYAWERLLADSSAYRHPNGQDITPLLISAIRARREKLHSWQTK